MVLTFLNFFINLVLLLRFLLCSHLSSCRRIWSVRSLHEAISANQGRFHDNLGGIVVVLCLFVLLFFQEYLFIQNGNNPTRPLQYESTRRYIINGRDLSNYVHHDGTSGVYQTFLLSMLTMIERMNVPLKQDLPYQANGLNQEGFGTFGSAHIASLLGEATGTGLRAQFYSKWFVHRRYCCDYWFCFCNVIFFVD